MTLRRMFWHFLIELLLGLGLSVAVPWMFLWMAVNFGIANYADASENVAKTAASLLETAEDDAAVLGQLSAGVKYLILDASYGVVDTSMDEAETARAMQFVKSGTIAYDAGKQYLRIERGERYIILQYEMGSFYTNDWMDEHLPPPEYLLVILIVCNAILYSVFLITRFERKQRCELTPVFEATRQIAAQNLEFEVGHSGIKEFEDILLSFSDMKEELGASLKLQWKTEQYQKEQIAALAHDLKTPLTIAQGNMDLLAETTLTGEQAQYVSQTSDSVGRMTDYVQLLIELSRAAIGYEYHFTWFALPAFIESIEKQAAILCYKKEIILQAESDAIPEEFYGDAMLLERAVMNLIGNAVEHTPRKGKIVFAASKEEGELELSVSDSGAGFSAEALAHAKELFFMNEHSRNSQMHFGMGLYFADRVVCRHHGTLALGNMSGEGGARVVIRLPIGAREDSETNFEKNFEI